LGANHDGVVNLGDVVRSRSGLAEQQQLQKAVS
jgi:hypothetical protein